MPEEWQILINEGEQPISASPIAALRPDAVPPEK